MGQDLYQKKEEEKLVPKIALALYRKAARPGGNPLKFGLCRSKQRRKKSEKYFKKKFQLKNLIIKGSMEPSEPERAAEAREARRSGEF